MALRYDFDILPVCDDAPAASEDMAPARELGASCMALFRDPATVDALKAAPDGLRVYLEASGFGLTAHDSGAPEGTYPAEDEETRLALIAQLAARLPHADLTADDLQPATPKDDSDRFDLPAFLHSLETAQPLAQDPPAPPEPTEADAWDSAELAAAETAEPLDPDTTEPAPRTDPEDAAESPAAPPEEENWVDLIAKFTEGAERASPPDSAAEDDAEWPSADEGLTEDREPDAAAAPDMAEDIWDAPGYEDDVDTEAAQDPAPDRKLTLVRLVAGIALLAGLILAAPLVMDKVMPLVEANATAIAR